MKRPIYLILAISFGLASCHNLNNEKTQLIPEETVLVQLRDYYNSLLNGNVTKVTYYLYPVLFDWLDKEFSTDSEYSKEAYVTTFVDEMVRMKKFAESENYEFGMSIGEITKTIHYNEKIIFLVDAYMYVKRDNSKREVKSVIVCISVDKGKNWKFIEKEEGTDKVLSMAFPQEVIDDIMID